MMTVPHTSQTQPLRQVQLESNDDGDHHRRTVEMYVGEAKKENQRLKDPTIAASDLNSEPNSKA